jgi:hypothetical protein
MVRNGYLRRTDLGVEGVALLLCFVLEKGKMLGIPMTIDHYKTSFIKTFNKATKGSAVLPLATLLTALVVAS